MQQIPLKPEDVMQAGTPESELNPINRYNDFTWWVRSDGWTMIGDRDCNKIACFMRTLETPEIITWCDGYEQGHQHGIEKGKTIKAHEVKRALGL